LSTARTDRSLLSREVIGFDCITPDTLTVCTKYSVCKCQNRWLTTVSDMVIFVFLNYANLQILGTYEVSVFKSVIETNYWNSSVQQSMQLSG
jgi:hypothetical protein